MSDTVNYSKMSDEEFMEALEVAGSEPQEEEDEIVEDTNQEEDSTEDSMEDAGTEQEEDETPEDTESEEEEDEEDEPEGNTHVENSNDDDETEEQVEVNTEAGSTESESESDDSETKDTPAEDTPAEDEVNYEEQYKALLSDNDRLKGFENFYNEVTSEFTANGKKVKGFNDPKKIIESQQMAAGFSDKMASFSKYKPFMNSIKDNGFLENPEKFNLAMQLLEGDQEALKKHIKDLEIDPFEMDMENINYNQKNQVSSDLEIAYGDVIENAKLHNVDTQVQQVINKDWDDKSVIELLEDPQSQADLVNHISTGAYEVVQARIADKKRTDVNNVYSRQPMIEQYRTAAREIEGEYKQYVYNQNEQARVEQSQVNEPSEEAIQAEMARIKKERTDETYRTQVAEKNAKANVARKKATSVSKKKPRTKSAKKAVFDPSTANDEEFSKYMDSIIYAQ